MEDLVNFMADYQTYYRLET